MSQPTTKAIDRKIDASLKIINPTAAQREARKRLVAGFTTVRNDEERRPFFW